MIAIIFVLIAAYIIGSFPVGVWTGRVFFGKDIRSSGSGNIGATNAYRVLGPFGGLVVFAGDFLKGTIPVLLMKSVSTNTELAPWFLVAAGMVAIIGHTFSIFLKFKGGKAASTAIGVISVLAPFAMILITSTWFIVLGVTRYVSVASMVAATIFPIIVLLLYRGNTALLTFSLLVVILIIYKHRSNINRLIHGSEPKVGQR